MVQQSFSHVDIWVFDLDNTLYPPHMCLFPQIELRMRAWVMATLGVDEETAEHLRKKYWAEYGTTLAGLMAEHDVDPDPYLHEVHDIDFSTLEADAELAAHIAALPGRKLVYTNGSRPYAERVIEGRGLSGLFEAVYGIEHADFRPKPERAAFETIFTASKVDPTRAAMFEDDPRNLRAPHEMGMRTVHVAADPHPADHIHHHTDDLTAFLRQLDGLA